MHLWSTGVLGGGQNFRGEVFLEHVGLWVCALEGATLSFPLLRSILVFSLYPLPSLPTMK